MPAVDVMESVPAATAKETSKSIGVLEELIKKLTISKNQDEANKAATNVASLLHGPIEEQSLPAKLVSLKPGCCRCSKPHFCFIWPPS
jgi:elongation factor 3